jgi:hypothetical protein
MREVFMDAKKRTGFLAPGLALVGVLLLFMQGTSQVYTSATTAVNPSQFVKVINNPYFFLEPGTTCVYAGYTDEGREILQVTVSHQKKIILGVECTVVTETVMSDGILNEVSVNWYAQDKTGNVWYFGEDSKLYEKGLVTSTEGSWEAGKNGASAGIIMEGTPHIGDIYQQELAPGIAEDMAQVTSTTKTVKVRSEIFTSCLKTKEWTPLDPGVVEFKWYAKGVGMILGESEGKNRLELIEIIHLP